MSNFVAFRRLHLEDWRQFRSVDIEVHSRLTLITGANGAGKSTILNLFTQHFGVNRVFLSTPKRKNEGGYSYDPGLYKLYRHLLSDDDKEVDNMEAGEIEPPSLPPQGAFIEVDKITYTNFVEATLGFHQQQVGAYRLSIQNPQSVVGVYIGSHRFVPVYQPVQKKPVQPMLPAQAYSAFFQEIQIRAAGTFY